MYKRQLLDKSELTSENIDFLNNEWINLKDKLSELMKLFEEEDALIKTIESYSQDQSNFKKLDELENYLSEIKKDIDEIEKFLTTNENFEVKFKVLPEDIADVVSKMTGIPLSKVVSNERKKLINLEKEISLKVIGQEKAITAISAAIRRARAGMKNPKRPIGSFLFMGPTGVGKTELAKSLAASLFDEEEALLRLSLIHI